MGRGSGETNATLPRPRRGAQKSRSDAPAVGHLGTFEVAPSAIARGWRLDLEEIVGDFRSNAKHASRMIERRVARALGGEVAAEGATHDVELPDGTRIEVRCFTNKVSFAPSGSIGSGRKVTAESLAMKFGAVDAFVVCDVTRFPRVEAWFVSAAQAADWRARGIAGVNGSISAKRFIEIAGNVGAARLASEAKDAGSRNRSSDHAATVLSVQITVERWDRTPKISTYPAPVSAEVFASLSTIKTNALLAAEGISATSDVIEAAAMILEALTTPEILKASSEPLTANDSQFFQLLRLGDDDQPELLLDVGSDRNLIDLVARYATGDIKAASLAFADALAIGWVANSSPEAGAAGFPVELISDHLRQAGDLPVSMAQ